MVMYKELLWIFTQLPDDCIVLDTETTGFDPKTGDRLVEIGCIEVVDFMPTGRSFHEYCDPLRDMPALVARLPPSLRGLDTSAACALETLGGIEMLHCRLVYPNYRSNPVVPALDFGMLGAFPPLPAQLDVDARAAF